MRRPSPALVLSIAALVVALGGTAVAKRQYVITSTKQISPKVLAQLRGRTGPVGPTGLQGPPGTNGAAGAPGTDGAAGPSDVVAGSRNDPRVITGAVMGRLALPAGSWLVVATFAAYTTNPGDTANLSCSLLGGDSTEVGVSGAPTQVTASRTIDLATAGDVELQCPAPAKTTAAKAVRMYAIRSGALTAASLD